MKVLECGMPIPFETPALAIRPYSFMTEDNTKLFITVKPHIDRVQLGAKKDDIFYGQAKVQSGMKLADATVEKIVKDKFAQKGITVESCKMRYENDFGFAIGYYHTKLVPSTVTDSSAFEGLATMRASADQVVEFTLGEDLAKKLGLCYVCLKPDNHYVKKCDCIKGEDGKLLKKRGSSSYTSTDKIANRRAALDRIRKRQRGEGSSSAAP